MRIMEKYLLLLISICLGSSALPVSHDSDDVVLKLSEANDDFALQLLQILEQVELSKPWKDRGNLFISSFSVGTVLAMALSGAMGQTYEQMYSTLG